MLLIFSPHITNRLLYTCTQVFEQNLGCGCTVTQEALAFANYTGPRLNYSALGFNSPIPQIVPAGLLFEAGVEPQPIQYVQHEGINCPFAVPGGTLPFDVLSAIFYLLSRYEEYLPHEKNKYGQFIAANSMAHQQGFLTKPVVDVWAQQLLQHIQAAYPQLGGRPPVYSALFTYDIDTAYAYKGRTLPRRLGSTVKDILQSNKERLQQRKAVLAKQQADPYDTYTHIEAMRQQHGHDVQFFFLLGNRNPYNRNLHYRSKTLQALIRHCDAQQPVGIHPSYYTDADKALLEKEKQRLQAITGRPVTRSRQHYLRFVLPTTFENLAASGITDDYTMGYAETPGFRAGTCNPFQFFNLLTNSAVPLRIHPFAFMEGSFAEDMQLAPAQALPHMLQLLQEVKAVQGRFSCIWHNHSLSNTGFWQGWHTIHDQIAAAASPHA